VPRWTRDRSLEVLPRAGDHLTPGGYRVPAALLWHLAVEQAQRYGVATLPQLLRRVGVPAGATLAERRRAMRILTAAQVLALTDWIEGRIAAQRPRLVRATGARRPLEQSRTFAGRGRDGAG
jgi:hypothetical protein